jgi:PTH1 family peptidyl-tRNA hydrolase
MPASELRAVIGLGNPGADYARTRHNAGFWFADALAEQARASFRAESKFLGDLAKLRVAEAELLVLKPATFMNRSGEAVQRLAQFYKLAPAEILVVHDELDLPPGVARLKRGGGHGGHNGLRSVHQHLGPDYLRLRLGVGHPGHKDRVHDYLTSGRAPKAEEALVLDAIAAALETLPVLIEQGLEKAMNRLHTKPDNGETSET